MILSFLLLGYAYKKWERKHYDKNEEYKNNYRFFLILSILFFLLEYFFLFLSLGVYMKKYENYDLGSLSLCISFPIVYYFINIKNK